MSTNVSTARCLTAVKCCTAGNVCWRYITRIMVFAHLESLEWEKAFCHKNREDINGGSGENISENSLRTNGFPPKDFWDYSTCFCGRENFHKHHNCLFSFFHKGLYYIKFIGCSHNNEVILTRTTTAPHKFSFIHTLIYFLKPLNLAI